MGTIIDYLKEYGGQSFYEKPMNDVDSLALCQFSYLKFDGMVPGVKENGRSVTLEELAARSDRDKLFADERFEKENRELFEKMLHSRRFRTLRMNCYINIVETEWETQFSAITFLLEDNTMYIAFRGTDETIIGWKEDFNMAFLSPVPGQELSVKYLNTVTGRLHSPFYIGGHSKGGNLAVYSAMNCIPKVQERILKVYSMDGPGFRPEVLAECRYDEIADKVVKILPHSSLVGMLFETDIRYRVVESKTFGLAQHDPFSWLVKDGQFVEVDGIYEKRMRMDKAINQWILSLDETQLRTFVDTLYQVVSASQAKDLIEFTADWKKSMNGMVAAMKEIDKQTADMLRAIVKSLFEIAVGKSLFKGVPGKRKSKQTEGTKPESRPRRKLPRPAVPGAIAAPKSEDVRE